eukprot:767091-Hanusia_phi.AAC.7
MQPEGRSATSYQPLPSSLLHRLHLVSIRCHVQRRPSLPVWLLHVGAAMANKRFHDLDMAHTSSNVEEREGAGKTAHARGVGPLLEQVEDLQRLRPGGDRRQEAPAPHRRPWQIPTTLDRSDSNTSAISAEGTEPTVGSLCL